jgi:hypothetical protein
LNENIPGKQEETPVIGQANDILAEVYDCDEEEDGNKIELSS